MLKNAVRFAMCLALATSAFAQQPATAKDSASRRSQPGDSVKAHQPEGRVRIGTPTANAAFYVDGASVGPIGPAVFYSIPAGRPVRISIRAPQCKRSWDSTITVSAGAVVTIGRRLADDCTR